MMDATNPWGTLLKAVPQIERLEEELEMIKKDIEKVYLECAGVGLDVGVLRKLIAMRRMPVAERQREEAHFALYTQVLGGGEWPEDHLHPGNL